MKDDKKRQAWECKIGVMDGVEVPFGGDSWIGNAGTEVWRLIMDGPLCEHFLPVDHCCENRHETYREDRTLTDDKSRCHWRVAPTDRPERGGVIWSSECRHKFELLDGRPRDYEMFWCPFCGKELVHDQLDGIQFTG